MESGNNDGHNPLDPKRIVYAYVTTYTFDPTCTRIVAVSPEVRVAETLEEHEARLPSASGGIVTTYTYDFPGPFRKPGGGPR